MLCAFASEYFLFFELECVFVLVFFFLCVHLGHPKKKKTRITKRQISRVGGEGDRCEYASCDCTCHFPKLCVRHYNNAHFGGRKAGRLYPLALRTCEVCHVTLALIELCPLRMLMNKKRLMAKTLISFPPLTFSFFITLFFSLSAHLWLMLFPSLAEIHTLFN